MVRLHRIRMCILLTANVGMDMNFSCLPDIGPRPNQSAGKLRSLDF